MRTNAWLQGFLKGVKAGTVGVILAVVPSLAKVAFPDLPAIAIFAIAALVILRFRVNTSLLVISCGMLGIALRFLSP
jgi:chromate transport protein ChrA